MELSREPMPPAIPGGQHLGRSATLKRISSLLFLVSFFSLSIVARAEDPAKKCDDKVNHVETDATERAQQARRDADSAATNSGGKIKGSADDEKGAGGAGKKILSDANKDLGEKNKECKCEDEKKEAEQKQEPEKSKKKRELEDREKSCAGLIAGLQ